VCDIEFLRRHTDRPVKITIPGAFTMAKLALDEHYRGFGALVMAFAAAVNEEVRDLKAAGADVIQIDEPYIQAHANEGRRWGIAAIDRARDGLTAVHLCFGLRVRRQG
jgi:5-methyltetrahydropteroyltriglutamate--homocysteine methyltransferase